MKPSVLSAYDGIGLQLACCRRHKNRQLIITTPPTPYQVEKWAWDYLQGRGWELCMAKLGPVEHVSFYHWNRTKAIAAGPSRREVRGDAGYQRQMF